MSSISKLVTMTFEVAFSIVFAILFLFLLNTFYTQIPFLNEDFEQVLPLYNASVAISIFLNASRLLVRSKAYKVATEVVSNIIFLVIAYQLWTVFPFDTSVIGEPQVWNTIFKLLIVLPTIGVMINVIKIIANKYSE